MTVLSIILICVAVALAGVSRTLRNKQAQSAEKLSQKLHNNSEDDEWNAQWDEAEAAIDEDVYRLLHSTSGMFRWGAIILVIVAVLIFLTSLL